MSRHEGVSCDSCMKGNFRGKRYKCLICYDYDLCASCYEAGATTTRHTTEHPMQCILTRSDYELFYGGEALSTEQPQSLTCPFCGRMGFTEATLQDHVTSEHSDITYEVVCPVCASLTGGDPNHVTDDFASHLTLEHRSGPRDLDEPTLTRHSGVRRIPHPGRGVAGSRGRRSNMHFSRDSMDPIAELLSQLSGARRAGTGGGTSHSSTTSQLQQLQMQLHLERQQAQAACQQLERLPRRQPATSTTQSSNAAAPSQPASANTDSSVQTASSGGQFLLERITELSLSEQEQQQVEVERSDRSMFVQELVLATLSSVEAEIPESGGVVGEGSESAVVGERSVEKPDRASPGSSAGQQRASQLFNSNIGSVDVSTRRTGSNTGGGTGRGTRMGVSVSVRDPVVRVSPRPITGTGTIREVTSAPTLGTGIVGERVVTPLRPPTGTATAGGSPGATRRKQVRPIEPRNQPTEPPPPH